MADQKDRQQHAGISHHLHQPLEAGQRLVVQVMRLVDHPYDRALALAHDVAQVALAALGLLGNLHLGTVTGREIVEQRLEQRGQRGSALVDRKRPGDGDLARPGQLVLDAAPPVRLARSDQAGDEAKPDGLPGRTRSDERREAKECVSKWRTWWTPHHKKNTRSKTIIAPYKHQ